MGAIDSQFALQAGRANGHVQFRFIRCRDPSYVYVKTVPLLEGYQLKAALDLGPTGEQTCQAQHCKAVKRSP